MPPASPPGSSSSFERLADGLFHLVLVKILHQPQHLDKLARALIAHARFYQPAQAVEAYA